MFPVICHASCKGVPMSNPTAELSIEELGYQLCVVNANDPPYFISMLLFHCRRMIAERGISWSDLGTTEFELQVMFNASRVKQLTKKLMAILAINQRRPLNRRDAQRIWNVLEELERHNADWRQLPIKRNSLLDIIEIAEEGYVHHTRPAQTA